MRRKEKQTSKKPFIIIAALAVVIVVGAIAFIWNGRQAGDSGRDTSDKPRTYEPATEEEKQQAEEHKKTLEEKDGTPVEENDTPPSASVVITSAGQYLQTIEVRSYVSGIIEENGTCTLTLTKGSQHITRTTTGVGDARYTACPAFEVPRSELTEGGTWQVKVSYASSSTKEVTATQSIEVN